ncbi:von Willebrand factor type A domain-containing protein [Chaetomium fimeti]|uniref:von Willebrand factor type A domain-containing protein n=1 Tax=Chaetomium fimeti TaxID=1854472 RepID=A0AAE0HJH8_9PEZI|nr:von Willebrand factor type A domain-containing protein [Chaetomium fimeti]
MARQRDGLGRIFAAGIVWDPEEPLPEELQDDGMFSSGGESQDVLDVVPFRKGLSAAGHGYGRFGGLNQVSVDHSSQPAAATWPIGGTKSNKLPRFAVQEQGRNVLPPLSVTADASIVQDTAKVTVTQLFWNDSGVPIKEAAFTFPLATGCTVTGFSCRIGTNKIIKGAVKAKEEAREAFRHHIRHHETAAGLLEQDTPEIFTTTLGNVPERTKVKVELTYITVLKHRFSDTKNTATLTLPTSIAPRYGDVPEEYNDAATTNVPHGLALEIEIVESERIASIVSTTHAVAVTRRRGARTAQSFADLAGEGDGSNVETASVTLESGRIFLDKDFVLDIVTTSGDNEENPQAWLEQHPTMPDHKTLMLTLPSGFLARNAPPMQRSEILFLADCSGSMKDKIKPLRSAMQFFLKGIPEGRKFNIWCFGTKYASWQPRSVDYTEETLNSALSWVETDMKANMGGTELLPAVQAIVTAREKALMTDVIVLTDGQTWRLGQTLDFIQKTRGLTEGRVRFFALGIGRAVSHALVDGIAKAGGGYADVVQEASQGGWEDRVVSMAKAALMSAHLGPLHLAFNIQDQTGNIRSSTLADAKRSPADTSALNPFDRSRIYFHLDCLKNTEDIKSVRVEVQANHDTKTLTIPVIALGKRDTTLHKLAARAMLDDLERGRSHIHLGPDRPLAGSWQETSMVRKEAEEIACQWSLVSKWTSFFLAEECYTPTGNDAFMDGVMEVKVSPGDDLLLPHPVVQHIATLQPADSAASASGPHNLAVDAVGSAPRNHGRPRNISSMPPPVHKQSRPSGALMKKLHRDARDGGERRAEPDGSSTSKEPRLRSRGDEKEKLFLERLQHRFDSSEESRPSRRSGSSRRSDVDPKVTCTTKPVIATPAGSSAQCPSPDSEAQVRCAIESERSPDDRRASRRAPPPPFGMPPNVLGEARSRGSGELSAPPRAPPSPTASDYPTSSLSRNAPPTTSLRGWQPSSTPGPGNQSGPPKRYFVSSFLNFQQYDGAVDFGSWVLAETFLGKDTADELRSFKEEWQGLSDRGVWTAAVHVLLERNFQSCKSLWELMAIKTASYCASISLRPGSDLLEVVRRLLEGLKLPFDQQQEERTVDAAPETVTVDPVALADPKAENGLPLGNLSEGMVSVPSSATVAHDPILEGDVKEHPDEEPKKRKAEKEEQSETAGV